MLYSIKTSYLIHSSDEKKDLLILISCTPVSKMAECASDFLAQVVAHRFE